MLSSKERFCAFLLKGWNIVLGSPRNPFTSMRGYKRSFHTGLVVVHSSNSNAIYDKTLLPRCFCAMLTANVKQLLLVTILETRTFPSPYEPTESEESRVRGIGDSAWGQGISGHQWLGIVTGNSEHQRLGIVAGNHEHQQLGIVAEKRNRWSRIDTIRAITSNAQRVLHEIRYRSDAV